MVTTLKLSSHNVVQREKLENSFECTFEVSFSSKTCLVSLSFVASHFCLCSSVKAATLEKFENGMNFFWHSRLMSGWSKTFVLCKKKRRNCCKSWTNWQREILGLDVPFLDEKIIAKYLRILPSHLKVTTHTGAKWHILSKNSTCPQMTSLASIGLNKSQIASISLKLPQLASNGLN